MARKQADDFPVQLLNPGCLVGGIGLALSVSVLLFTSIPSIWLVNNLAIAKDTPNWTPTPATITRCETQTTRQGQHGRITSLLLEYQYEADGSQRTGTRYAWLGNTTPAATIVTTHPVGAQVTCFVDPAHPDRAVLVQGTDEGGSLGMFFPIVAGVALLGVIASLIAIARSRKAEPMFLTEDDDESEPVSPAASP